MMDIDAKLDLEPIKKDMQKKLWVAGSVGKVLVLFEGNFRALRALINLQV